jgi:flagellar M-ring protein FliF
MEYLSDIFKNQFKPWWDDLNGGARLLYVGVTLALLIAAVVTLVFIFSPTYETLYVGLDAAEAGQVAEKLKEYKVGYRLENGGTTIAVPRSDIYEVRLKLASEGLPRSGSIGYEIFDESNLGMTEFLQKVNYRRALEGEIARSISSIRGVQSARVHIVIPESRLFREAQKDATASVVLSLGGAGGISSSQVEGIVYLVSSSVEGLSPDRITILDSAGRLLSRRNSGSELGALSASQLEMRKQVESYLEGKALSMLDPVVGSGKAVVRISAKLNFEQVEQTIENFDPDNPTIRSEERITESSSEENSNPDDRGKNITNSTENVVTNYEISRTVQHVVNSVGNIDKLWVSILVDGVYEEIEGEGGLQEQYAPRSREELDQIAGIVKGAVGFDSQRNDVMEIASAPFTRQEYDYSDPFFSNERIDEWLRIGGKLILFALAVFVFFKGRKRFAEFMKRQNVEAKRRAAQRETLRKRDELIPRVQGEPQLADHLKEMARQKPDEIAKVVKTMMAEETE